MLHTLAFALLLAAPPETGLAPTLAAPDAKAELANRAGLDALRKGRPADAITSLLDAIARAPTFDMARYNLVCARALLNTPESLNQAATDLADLLRRDHPTFAPRWSTDPDLDALRRSAHATDLDALSASLTQTWADVRARGAFGLLVHRRPPKTDDGTPDYQGLDHVAATRVGVYDPSTGRFFPTAPPIRNIVAARHAPDFTQLFAVDYDFCTIDFCPRPTRLSSWIYLPHAKAPTVSRLLSSRDDIMASDLYIKLADRGAWLTIPGAMTDPGGEGEPEYPAYTWIGLTPEPPPAPKAPRISIDHRGVIGPPHTPSGFALERGVLSTPSGGTVDLGFRHRRDTRSLIFADTTTALVVSNRDACICNAEYQGGIFWSGISVVDLKTLQITHHRHQDMSATATVTPSGVYLQLGATVTHYPSLADIALSSGAPTAPSFVLELLPLKGPYCCGK